MVSETKVRTGIDVSPLPEWQKKKRKQTAGYARKEVLLMGFFFQSNHVVFMGLNKTDAE